ncbi:hypothetical protein NPIL_635871 [Nephila pilipes]|uniref:Uncharacterized protein n=1 Tax=Nephila pilipes TaxID=299642 RepID=A0A8X6MIN5_NEPPI|nr:hypothetical protein NPIL_635871 [Nephila pilipes]
MDLLDILCKLVDKLLVLNLPSGILENMYHKETENKKVLLEEIMLWWRALCVIYNCDELILVIQICCI